MWKMILSDGRELAGCRKNGTNYVSDTQVDTAIFEGNLSPLVITNGEEVDEYARGRLVQQVQYEDGWYLCFEDIPQRELLDAAILGKIDYLAMMADVELEPGELTAHALRSPKFAKVQGYYRLGAWSKAMVYNAVAKGWLTSQEYGEIVGDENKAKEGFF